MTILLRLRVGGKVVSLIETDSFIELEVHGGTTRSAQAAQEEKDRILHYMEDEGILDEVLSGHPNFAQQLQLDAQDLLKMKAFHERNQVPPFSQEEP
jgi:hypothetical protein